MAPGRAFARLAAYAMFEGRPLTTRGRWWNPVVLSHLRLACHLSRKRADNPIFIVGMGRSGTTLLGQILATHPEVGYLNEPKAAWHVIYPGEDIIGSYSRQAHAQLSLHGHDATLTAKRRAHAIYSWFLSSTRSTRVVDKYPELVFRDEFIRALFARPLFLVLLRSPFSVIRSVELWTAKHGSPSADWWGFEDRKWTILWTQGVIDEPANHDLLEIISGDTDDHRIRAAVEWTISTRRALRLLSDEHGTYLVDYDQLVSKPAENVQRILAFCDLEQDHRPVNYARAIVAPTNLGDRAVSEDLALPAGLSSTLAATWSRVEELMERRSLDLHAG
jgi:hypothetical protein